MNHQDHKILLTVSMVKTRNLYEDYKTDTSLVPQLEWIHISVNTQAVTTQKSVSYQ